MRQKKTSIRQEDMYGQTLFEAAKQAESKQTWTVTVVDKTGVHSYPYTGTYDGVKRYAEAINATFREEPNAQK